VWQGGEGGDFLMSMVNYMLNGIPPTINKNGTANQSADFTWQFGKNGSRCRKAHALWGTNEEFLNAKDKTVIWLNNPDPIIWAKKKLLKVLPDFWGKRLWNPKLDIVEYNPVNKTETEQFTGVRVFDSKILKAYAKWELAIKQKDWGEAKNHLADVYYWYYPHLKKAKVHYHIKMENIISAHPHIILNYNMTTVEEITSALERSLAFIGRPWSQHDKLKQTEQRYNELQLQTKQLCKCLDKIDVSYADIIRSWDPGLDGTKGFDNKNVFDSAVKTLTILRKTLLEKQSTLPRLSKLQQSFACIDAIKRITSIRKILQDQNEQDNFIFPKQTDVSKLIIQYVEITQRLLNDANDWKYNEDN